jgi:hypothetical protein
LFFLQSAQDFRLQSDVEFADFVKNKVPPSATSNKPFFSLTAPVNEPFSCPNKFAFREDSH